MNARWWRRLDDSGVEGAIVEAGRIGRSQWT